MIRNPGWEDAPLSPYEQKKAEQAKFNSKWKKFEQFGVGFAEGLGQAFTGPGSIGSFAAKGFRAGAGVLQRNPAAAETLKDAGQVILAPAIQAASRGQDLIEYASGANRDWKEMERKVAQKQYEEIKQRDPKNPILEEYEKQLAKPLPEAIESPAQTATALGEIYDSIHENSAQYLLSKNPDVIKAAQETNQSVWDAADAYSKEISFGQSAFDLIATNTNKDSIFDINITDVEQRKDMFYEGDGLVGKIGKGGSGAIDLSMQLFGDPFWVAGKGAQLARLGFANVETVAQAEKGVRGLTQQSYFVDGKEGIVKFREVQSSEKFITLKDDVRALEQERNTWQLERDLYRAQIDSPNPGQVVDVEANLFNINIADEQIARIDTQISEMSAELNAALPKVSAGRDEFHQQLPFMSVAQIMEHEMVKNYGAMKNRIAAAYHLASRTGDRRDLIDLDLIGMGIDPGAADRLRERSESLYRIIEDQKIVMQEFVDYAKIQAGDLDSAAVKEVYKTAYDNAYALRNAYIEENNFLKLMVAQEGDRSISMVGMLDPRGVSRFRTVERARANRARTKADLTFDDMTFTNLGRSIFVGRPLYGATERYRPNNMVTIEGIDQADGIDELTAWLQSGTKQEGIPTIGFTTRKVLGKEQSDKILSDFALARTRSEKQKVLEGAERTYLRTLLTSLNVKIPEGSQGDEVLDKFIDEWLIYKDEQTSILRQRAFYTTPADDLVDAPLLKPNLAYSYYMTDSKLMAAWAKDNVPELNKFFGEVGRNLTEGKALAQILKTAKDMPDLLDQMWRFGVLARLGYPVRNVGAEWLKFAVVGGMLKAFSPQYTSGRELPTAVKKSVQAWFSNKHAFIQRAAISLGVRKENGVMMNMNQYPELVQMNNHLREGDIKFIIGDEDYLDFVKRAEDILANPEKAKDLSEVDENAVLIYSEIIKSQERLVEVTNRYNSLAKVKRNTGHMYMYGYEVEEAYFGTQGIALQNSLSSGATQNLMTGGKAGSTMPREWMGVEARVMPEDPEYFPNLSEVITKDFVNSEAAKEVIRVSVLDPDVLGVAREEAIQKFTTDAALREEIMQTGRYQLYEQTIKAEQLALKDELKQLEEKATKLINLSDKDLTILNEGKLPERFGPASPEYQKAVKAEKKRLTDEFQMDPDYVQKVENTGSELGLSTNGKEKLAKQGLISLRAIKNAYANGRLSSDEISAMLSAGNIESVSANGVGHEMYRYYTIQEIEDLCIKTKNGLYFQVPWAQTGADDYVSFGLKNFENNYYATRVEDLLTEHELKVEAANRLSALRKQINDPENLTVEELLEVGIKDIDERSIQERYFDDIYKVVTSYLPSTELRSRVLNLGPTENISPQELRLMLSRSGQALKPIIGDLLIAEERVRARKLKFSDDYVAPKTVVRRQLDEWLLRGTRFSKPSPKRQNEKGFVYKTDEEAIRADEASKRLAAFDEDITVAVAFDKFRQRVFRIIGQIPEDNLVKWPFGRVAYNAHVEKIARNWYKAGFEPSPADLYALHTSARARAISESRKYLYSAQRKLVGPGNVPFLGPFYQAAVIGSKNWARVAWNDPSIIARRAWMYNYINEHADYDKKNGNRTLTIRMPGWLIDSIDTLPGNQSALQGALKAFPNAKFNVNSFNLMFPGMRFGEQVQGSEPGDASAVISGIGGNLFEAVVSSIGAGPLVVIGVETYVRMNPSIDQDIFERTGKVVPIRSILDKIAPSENITADPIYYDALPPYLKRATALIKGVDSAEYARISLLLYMTKVHQMETGEIERVPLTEIEATVANETAALIGFKALANATLPAIPAFEGEVNDMLKIYREYQDTHKEKAFAEFVEDYPSWYIVAASMSKNQSGVLSTIDSQKMLEKHSKPTAEHPEGLIAAATSLGGPEGEAIGIRFLGMLANREGAPSDFDPASRVWAIDNEIYGRYKTSRGAIEDTMIQKGNYDYYKERDARDLQIKIRGQQIGKPDLTSRNTSDPVVAALNTDFKNWVNRQFEENPVWFTKEWEPKDQNKIQPTAIRFARMLIADKNWMADQEPGNYVTQLGFYLEDQENYAKLFANAKSSGEQKAIKEMFQADIDALKAANANFALYYDRHFEGANEEPFMEIVLKEEVGK